MFQGYSTLITGPTKGIGKELAELFAKNGSHLILVSRDAEKLAQLKNEWESRYGIRCKVIARDLAVWGSHEALAADIRRAGLGVDILVNNAGFGVYGKFHEEEITPQIGMIQLHVTLPTYLSHVFLPQMIRNERGGILNVASTAAFQPVPIENVYGATKSYLLHFTEALVEEVGSRKVRISCLCPGPTETPFFDTVLMKSSMPVKIPRMSAARVAQIGFDAFCAGKPVAVAGLSNWIMSCLPRFAPRRIIAKVAKQVIEKKFKPRATRG